MLASVDFIATGGITFNYTTLVDIGLGAWNATSFDGMSMKSNSIVKKYRKLISHMKFKNRRINTRLIVC